jgi:hypothetical protein
LPKKKGGGEGTYFGVAISASFVSSLTETIQSQPTKKGKQKQLLHLQLKHNLPINEYAAPIIPNTKT